MSTKTADRHLTGNPAETYERTFVPAIAIPVSRGLLAAANLRPGERVLDVACGTGLIARLAAEQVGPSGSVAGVDISAEMIAVARTVPAPTAPEIGWHEGDAASLPLPDGAFDVVLCQMGLMFVNDKPGAAAEFARVLTAGGRVVLNTPGAIQPPLEIMDDALARHISADLAGFVRTVFSMPDPAVLEHLLRDAGLDDIEATTSTTTLRLPPPAEFLWQYIGSTPLAAFVKNAPDEARTALEHDVVERWQAFVEEGGGLVIEQPMVTASGRA